jgi:hypothetical protein
MYILHCGKKVAPKYLNFSNLKKTAWSEQTPDEWNFDQSGHPGRHNVSPADNATKLFTIVNLNCLRAVPSKW